MPKLYLPRQSLTLEIEPGQNLFEFLRRNRLPVQSSCGGMGSCGKCKVKFIADAPKPKTSESVHLDANALAGGIRLSCLHHAHADLSLELFEQDLRTDAKEQLRTELHVELDPGVEKVFLQLEKVSRHDQRPDTIRIEDTLNRGRLQWTKTALTQCYHALREAGFEITVTLDREAERVLDVEAGNTVEKLYGVAFDLGTTTLAGYLFDLHTGEELLIKSLMNPQRNFGADVIARIKHVRDRGQEALDELHEVLRSGVNALLKILCREALIKTRHIYKTVFAGNPTLVHFFIGLDPSGIDHSPYIPVTRNGLQFSGKELKLDTNPEAQVIVLPNLSGYVGGDITSGILATGIHNEEKPHLMIDIGTNAEIVLGNRKRLIACSSPAGPAFEGAEIQYGMSANPGAISHVVLSEDDVELEVIGDVEPKGICGSGLIDLVGQLRKVGLVVHKGNLCPLAGLPLSRRVDHGENDQTRFAVVDGENPVYLHQKDIRELQLAKGAVRSGVDIVLLEYGLKPDDLGAIYLAGAFGNFLQVENVLRVGLLPEIAAEKIIPVGNAAGTGARMCLLNVAKLKEIQALTEKIEYFELSNYGKFSDVFMASMLFPSLVNV